MSRDQEWRLGNGREVRYNKPLLQPPAAGTAGDMRGVSQPVMNGKLSKGAQVAQGMGQRPLGSAALPGSAQDSRARPLGSPAHSILAQGGRPSPGAASLQWHGAQQGQHQGAQDRLRRRASLEPQSSRSASPRDRNVSPQDRPDPAPVMSRLGRHKPPRHSLVPVELPAVLPARAKRLHQVC